MKKYGVKFLALSCVLASCVATAFEKGDIIVRAGTASVVPNESSSNIIVGGSDLGVDLTVDNDTQFGLNVAYFFTDNLNIEILAATPFQHDVNFGVSDPIGTGDRLGEVSHLPPTLTLNYYFLNPRYAFKPYVGVGVNYTLFFDEDFTGANTDAGLSDLSLDDSFGFSAQVGIDLMLTENWFVNSSARWIDIDTDATFSLNGTPGSVDDIEIDPWVFSFTVGYVF